MALSEFELISRFFSAQPLRRADVRLGIGDDAAVLAVPAGFDLVVTIDTLVEGVHFAVGTPPDVLGYKALAVGLSDLAAMGAEPAWATLALTLPAADERWLVLFSRSLLALAERHRVQLVGGDTTRGPLTISLQAHGLVPAGSALRRDGAREGDLIFVTGTLGDAGLALKLPEVAAGSETAASQALRGRLDRPVPRVEAGLALRDLAHAAIDVSDGLLADLGHVVAASMVGAEIDLEAIPLSEAYRSSAEGVGFTDEVAMRRLAVTAGDDYELCFTAPIDHQSRINAAMAALAVPCTCIGRVGGPAGLRCLGADGGILEFGQGGYEHFA